MIRNTYVFETSACCRTARVPADISDLKALSVTYDVIIQRLHVPAGRRTTPACPSRRRSKLVELLWTRGTHMSLMIVIVRRSELCIL